MSGESLLTPATNTPSTKYKYIIRDADEGDLPGILEIYNDSILNLTATWLEEPVDIEDRRKWMRDLKNGGFPIFVAVPDTESHPDGNTGLPSVLGYSSYGPFRSKTGYRFTVENSIYIHPSARSGGLGTVLMQKLLEHAKKSGIHVVIAATSSDNEASLRFHERLGFVEAGRIPEVGTKWGRWLNLVIQQLILPVTEKESQH